jgi:hypothetical protein
LRYNGKAKWLAYAQTLMTGFPNWDVMRVWSETTM